METYLSIKVGMLRTREGGISTERMEVTSRIADIKNMGATSTNPRTVKKTIKKTRVQIHGKIEMNIKMIDSKEIRRDLHNTIKKRRKMVYGMMTSSKRNSNWAELLKGSQTWRRNSRRNSNSKNLNPI